MTPIFHLIAMLSGTMAISSFPPTRFKMGKWLCEKYCADITGCDAFSYHPGNLFCFLGINNQDGFIRFHINKITANFCHSSNKSKIQDRHLVAKSGMHLCVRIFPSGYKEKGKGHLLIVSRVLTDTSMVNLQNMESRPYRLPFTRRKDIVGLDYVPWKSSLLLVFKKLYPFLIPVSQGRTHSFVMIKAEKCAVDRENKIVFLVKRTHKIVKVDRQTLCFSICRLAEKPNSFIVDSKYKQMFVSLMDMIVAVTYSGRKKVISELRDVTGLCIGESGNVLYALVSRQINIILVHQKNTSIRQNWNHSLRSIERVDSKVFILTAKSILIYEHNELKRVGKLPSIPVVTCVLP